MQREEQAVEAADANGTTADPVASDRVPVDSSEQSHGPNGHQSAETAAREASSAAEAATEAAAAAERAQQLTTGELADDPLLSTRSHRVAAGADEEHPLGHPGEPMREQTPFRIAFTCAIAVGLAVALMYAVVQVRQVLVLVLVAAFLAVGLDPAVRFLTRHRIRRSVAAGLVLLAVLVFFGGFFAAAVPPTTREATSLVKELPSYLDRIQHGNGFVAHLNSRYHLVDQLRQHANQGPTLGLSALGGVVGVGKAVLSAIFSVLTTIILTIYFLANLPGIKRGVVRLVPRTRRPRFGLILEEVLSRIGGYVLGNLATSVIAGLTALVFMLIVGIPYALALALLVAIFDLIPLVGASIAAAIVTLVAFFQSPAIGIITLLFFVAYQQFENYVIVPRVMKRTVDVSPLATIVAALIGGTLLGIVGALVAIPAAATVSLVLSEVIYPRQDDS